MATATGQLNGMYFGNLIDNNGSATGIRLNGYVQSTSGGDASGFYSGLSVRTLDTSTNRTSCGIRFSGDIYAAKGYSNGLYCNAVYADDGEARFLNCNYVSIKNSGAGYGMLVANMLSSYAASMYGVRSWGLTIAMVEEEISAFVSEQRLIDSYMMHVTTKSADLSAKVYTPIIQKTGLMVARDEKSWKLWWVYRSNVV
jgi:hypothetical protein